MKSSYKLFGTFWDGKPIPESKPEIQAVEVDCLGKKIYNLSDILRDENINEEDSARSQHNMIRIDYIPKCLRRCVSDFYICRLLQIVQYHNARIVCENKEDREQLLKMIDFYYERKTPIRLLAQSDGASQMIC